MDLGNAAEGVAIAGLVSGLLASFVAHTTGMIAVMWGLFSEPNEGRKLSKFAVMLIAVNHLFLLAANGWTQTVSAFPLWGGLLLTEAAFIVVISWYLLGRPSGKDNHDLEDVWADGKGSGAELKQ